MITRKQIEAKIKELEAEAEELIQERENEEMADSKLASAGALQWVLDNWEGASTEENLGINPNGLRNTGKTPNRKRLKPNNISC